MDLSYLYSFNEDALREIVYKNREQYETVVVETASAELRRRYQPLLAGDGDSLSLAKLIRRLSFEDFRKYLREYVGRKGSLSAYEKVFTELTGMEPDGRRSLLLTIQAVPKSDELLGTGTDGGVDNEPDLTFLTWGEWLAARIAKDQVLQIGPERIAAFALYTMTVNGFDRGDTEKCLQNLRLLAETDFQPADGEDEKRDGENEKEEEDENGDPEAPVYSRLPDSVVLARGLLQWKEKRSQKRKQRVVREIRPWVRFFARDFDYTIAGLLFSVVYKMISGGTAFPFLARWTHYIDVSALLWIPIEALLLSCAGTTPGKFLLRVAVRKSGRKLTFSEALSRSTLVWAVGSACALIYASTVAEIANYAWLKGHGQTWYDEKTGCTVDHQKIGAPRIIVFLLLQTGLLLATVFLLKRR